MKAKSFYLVLNVEMPTGAADLELPSGLTTVLSSEESFTEARNSTTLSHLEDPFSYFGGCKVEVIEASKAEILCTCGRLFSGYFWLNIMSR